jgi:methionyl aminopeptidase
VLQHGQRRQGLKLVPGMVFIIKLKLNAGKRETKQLADGWTVVTKDRSLTAQFEKMVAVTPLGSEVLTAWPGYPGNYAPFCKMRHGYTAARINEQF